MSTARHLHYTYAEYLAALAVSEIRLEYLGGEIFAMAGGSPEHGMIAARMIQILGEKLPKGCKVLTSDVKVRVVATGLSTFPDISVVCGDLERASDDANAITNPALLVEVLNPSTEDYDQGEKLRHYQQIPSLEAVVFVSQSERMVSVVRRTPSGWLRAEHRDAFELERTGTIAVTELYP